MKLGCTYIWDNFLEKVLSKQVGVNWVNSEDQGPSIQCWGNSFVQGVRGAQWF